MKRNYIFKAQIEIAKKEIMKELSHRRREVPFLVWFFSIIGFYGARLFVLIFPEVNLIISEFHIHHFYYGVILIVLAGALALTFKGIRLARSSAILYGLGLGITFDEIGLFLTEGNYWADITYVIFYTFLALSLVLFFLWDFGTSSYGKNLRKKMRKYISKN